MILYKAILFVGITCIGSSIGEEPHCLSRYDYDRKLLEQMLDLQQQLKQSKNMVLELKKRMDQMSEKDTGSVYTRWGKNICDGTATVVYTGYTAGKRHNEKGSGSDTICLPTDPTWLKYKDGVQGVRGNVYGTEINTNDGYSIFEYAVNNQDLPCAVCKTPRRTTLMIPGRGSCYDGWRQEYQGYLMTEYYNHPGSHNHICMDSKPDFIPNGSGDNNEHILYFTDARCGSLPCPPYVEGRELACVVCSI